MKPKHWYYYKYLESKYTLLLLALLLLLIVSPFIEGRYFAQFSITVWYNLIMVLAIIALRDKKHNIMFFLALGAANVIASTLDMYFEEIWISSIRHLLYAIFGISATIAILNEIATTEYITIDTIFGTLSTYLLIGLSFATVYILIEHLSPGSFVYSHSRQPVSNELELYYYSYITLTTVGYGDIVVTNVQVKPIVVLESITGIFYLATLVAKMVSSRYRQ